VHGIVVVLCKTWYAVLINFCCNNRIILIRLNHTNDMIKLNKREEDVLLILLRKDSMSSSEVHSELKKKLNHYLC